MKTLTHVALLAAVTSLSLLAGCAADAADVEDSEADVVADEASAVGTLPQFSCKQTPIKQAGSGEQAEVTAVRIGANAAEGYDRMVIQFAPTTSKPGYELTPQSHANFTMDGSGDEVKLAGSAGLDLLVRGANSAEFNGTTHFRPKGTKNVAEAKQTAFFEGDSAWGVGLRKATCYRVFRLANPPRLVVDVKHTR